MGRTINHPVNRGGPNPSLRSIIKCIFCYFWKKYLRNDHLSNKEKTIYNKVVKITGWRSAYIDVHGNGRLNAKFMIKIWKWYF
jgi:hypothetical protein